MSDIDYEKIFKNAMKYTITSHGSYSTIFNTETNEEVKTKKGNVKKFYNPEDALHYIFSGK